MSNLSFIDWVLVESMDSPYTPEDVTSTNQHIVNHMADMGFQRHTVKVQTTKEDPNGTLLSGFRANAWEIHHVYDVKGNNVSGINLGDHKNAFKFAATAKQFADEKLPSYMVRVIGTHDMIDNYHRMANLMVKKHYPGHIVGKIEDSIYETGLDIPTKMFTIRRHGGILEGFKVYKS